MRRAFPLVQKRLTRRSSTYYETSRILEEQYCPVWTKFAGLTQKLCPTEADGSFEPILDVASGPLSEPGLTIAKAMPHAKVVMSDADEATVEKIREAIKDLPHVDAQLAKATELPFADKSFDMLTCCFGLAYVDDKAKAVEEFQRVLKPGCELVLAHWTDFEPALVRSKLLTALQLQDDTPEWSHPLSCAKKNIVPDLLTHFDIAESIDGSCDFSFPNANDLLDALRLSLTPDLRAQALTILPDISSPQPDGSFRLTTNTFVINVAINPPC